MNKTGDTEARTEMAHRFDSDDWIAQAVRQAVRAAVEDHKLAGNPVADWQDGKVVIVPPEEIVLPEEEATKAGPLYNREAIRHTPQNPAVLRGRRANHQFIG